MKSVIRFIAILILLSSKGFAAKPAVWIYTDMSDKTLPGNNSEGTINDPDDISAMGGYILMCNEFNTLGIVVTSTHRSEHKTTPNQGVWANNYFGKAYKTDKQGLNKNIGGYPDTLIFTQSCIKETSEHYSNSSNYTDLTKYTSIKPLLELLSSLNDTINVLCWGSTTEPAILAKHCMANGKVNLLSKMRIIAHWTNSTLHQGTPQDPENVANCKEDLEACRYLKSLASQGKTSYYELGAIGQHGIVSGGPKGTDYFNQFKSSALGKIFAEGKFVYNGVDHSDAATYWTLLGTWGVSLKDVAANGSNPTNVEQANENTFKNWSKKIHDELLRRAKAATATSLTHQIPQSDTKLYSITIDQHLHSAPLLHFTILKETMISITLFDIKGKSVFHLLNSKMATGNHSIALEQSPLTSGVYIVKVQAGGVMVNHTIMQIVK